MLSIGESLKYQREIRNLSQNALSKEVDISQQKISYYESDKHTPTIEECVKLADYYGISLDELIGRDGY
ncbi:MAG: helix-turn-helix domain-containing protein [Clostridia bacterium]|nr:helix-turn-helix domain-containing protein [Clostridia bacterium]